MTITIQLPPYFSAQRAEEAISVCHGLLQTEGREVCLDASLLKFVDPFGLALLGATFFEFAQQDRSLKVLNLAPDIRAYLTRMDVFYGLNVDGEPFSSGNRNDRSDSLVELTRIGNRNEVDTAAFRLAKSLIGSIPGLDQNEAPDEMTGRNAFDQLLEPIQYALCELLENAMTHGRKQGYRSAQVWVASQYYPTSGLIRLGIVDTGCGFLETLRSHPSLRINSDYGAILAALKPRISCNRDLLAGLESTNQGVGLTTTSRIFASANGSMVIASGDAVHRTGGRSGAMTSGARWQGVAIALQCRRANLSQVRVRESLPPLEDTGQVKLRFE